MTEIILGPPGCGKTYALLNIVDQELTRGMAPDRLGLMTFTRRGAEVAISRACEKFSLTPEQLPYFRTLHSLAYRLLGLGRGDVLTRERLKEFSEWAGVKVSGRWSDDGTLEGALPGDRALFMDQLARVKGVTLGDQFETLDDGLGWTQVQNLSTALSDYKRSKGLVDFTDMLERLVNEELYVPLDVLMIDETQDTTPLQAKVINLLARGAKRLIVAGDDDQCIFSWAGADSNYLVDLQGSVSVLGQSYRVPRSVQTLANEIISGVAHRRDKAWAPRDEEGVIERVADPEEIDADGDDVLILARNTYVLRDQIEPLLRGRGIYFERDGKPSIDAGMLASIEAWERLRKGEPLPIAEIKLAYEQMTPDIGVKKSFKALGGFTDETYPLGLGLGDLQKFGGLLTAAPWYEALDRLPPGEVAYIRAARRRGEQLKKRPRVKLSTVHGSKGAEAHHVVLCTEMASRTYAEMLRSPDDERRVWYVGCTRARERLTLVGARGPLYYDL